MADYSVSIDSGLGTGMISWPRNMHDALDVWRGSLEAHRTDGATLISVTRKAPMLHAVLTRNGHHITVTLNHDSAQPSRS